MDVQFSACTPVDGNDCYVRCERAFRGCSGFPVAGRPLQPVQPELAARVAAQTLGERLQSEPFFASLRCTMR